MERALSDVDTIDEKLDKGIRIKITFNSKRGSTTENINHLVVPVLETKHQSRLRGIIASKTSRLGLVVRVLANVEILKLQHGQPLNLITTIANHTHLWCGLWRKRLGEPRS